MQVAMACKILINKYVIRKVLQDKELREAIGTVQRLRFFEATTNY